MTAAWSARVVAAPDQIDAFERAFAGLAQAVSLYEQVEGKVWAVEGLFAGAPPREVLAARIALAARALGVAEPALNFAPVPAKDWLSDSLASFVPLRAGRFYVHGDHIPAPYPTGVVRLQINAATAFGSGEHDSTRGCLLALDGLRRGGLEVTRALDMGCGTGILAIAMAKVWRHPVLAVDIDPGAVRVARHNAQRNGVAAMVKAVAADACGHRTILASAPYGLVTANILARPLAAMAADLAALLAPGGHLILAGLLQKQEAMVMNAYRLQGLALARRHRLKPWSTLVLRR